MKIIDVYVRISKAPDGSLEKTDRQISDCLDLAERRGLTIGKIHEDPNKSAWRQDVRRKGWETLLARYEAGEISGVIVWNTDRLIRQPWDLERLIKMADDHRGFTVLSCYGDFDLTDPDQRMQLRIKTAFAESESAANQRRTKRGLTASRMAGKLHGGMRAFGWPAAPKEGEEQTPTELVTAERKAIAEATRRYLAGDPLAAIARDLNKQGIRTTTGAEWTGVNLKQVLLRPRNAGLVDHHGVITGRLPEGEAIVSEADFELLTVKFAAQRRGRPFHEARLLTGIAHCGACGRHLNSRTRSGKNYADGVARVSYGCPWPRGCTKVSVDAGEADKAVAAFVVARLSDPRHVQQIEAQATAARMVDERIGELEATGRALADRLGRGELSLDQFDAANAPLSRRLAKLREEAERTAMPAGSVAVAGAQDAVRARWERATIPERRMMLRAALGGQRLIVDPLGDRHWRHVKVSDRLRVE